MTRYALVIGVSEYLNSRLDKIPKASTDAEEVAKVLETYGDFQVERLPKKWNEETEKWEVAKAKPVTKDEVITELKQLLWERGTKSEVLIYFAGHGIRFFDDLDELKGCLAVSDCKVQSKEGKVIVPTNGIALDTINRLITNEKCQISRLVMLLDCCHSGSLLENQEVRETLTVFVSKTDYYLIAGCRSFEKARAFRGEANSIFTGALLKGLSIENANPDGTVTTDLVFNVINQELKDSGQEPIRIGGGCLITVVKYSLSQVLQTKEETHLQTSFYVPKLEGSSIFVKRIKEIDKIVNVLLNQQQAQAKSVIALWSPSSYGKTTLAKMSCYEPRIKRYFTGGVFWSEIKDDLDAKKTLRKLYKNLTGCFEEDVEPYDLVQKWSKEPTLLVLDNVETEEELALFLNSSGESCQWLITTQRLDILANRNDLQVIELNSFNKEESIGALIKPFQGKSQIDKNDQKKIEELADLLYDWPILLNLALKDIQGQMNMPHFPEPKIVIDNLIKNIKDWMKFDHENKISKIIEKSLKYLTREEKECFKRLFIFSADLDIPYSIIEKIWGLSDIKVDVDTLCRKLYYLSLLKKYDIGQQVIQLHSYLRRYFLSNNEIKKSLAEINKKFVEYYKKQYNLNSPNNLPSNFPLPEKNFLVRVYKHHWKLAQKC